MNAKKAIAATVLLPVIAVLGAVGAYLAAGYGEAEVVATLLNSGADVLAKNEGGYTALAMAKQKHYVDVINMLHEAEHYAGVGEGSCESRAAPGSSVINFMKRPGA